MSLLELETRGDLMARISQPHGHSKADREDHIALLIVQMMKDISVVKNSTIDAVTSMKKLKGIEKVVGSRARMNELQQRTCKALELLEYGCADILSLTKNKKYTMDAERRFTTLEKKTDKRVNQKAIGIATIMQVTPPKSQPLKQNNVLDVIERRKLAAQKHTSLMKTRANPVRQSTLRQPSRGGPDDYSPVITLKDGSERRIPPPEHDKDKILYTIHELITHLSPYDGAGVKRIIKDLKESGRCCCSPTSFIRKLQKYKRDGILSAEDDYGDTMGRPTSIATESICSMMNAKEHANLSYVGDGLEESHKALSAGRKRKAQVEGICPENMEDYNRTTVSSYDRFATLMDPNISRVPKETARLKSIWREIISRSIRSYVCAASSAIVTGFAVGKWTKKDKYDSSLPAGTTLAHGIAEDSMDGVEMKPIKLSNIINGDDIGRFVHEGVTRVLKSRAGKASTKSAKRDTRKVSSVWRRASSEDEFVSGIKVKFKVLIAASGQVGPVVMHFYGFEETDLTKDFVVLKVPGLCIAGDVRPGMKDVGYVILSRGKATDDSGVTLSEQIMKWYHEEIVLPFVSQLRANNDESETYAIDENIGDGDIGDDCMVLKMDSDIPYINYLKRPEIQEMNRQRRIVVVKISAAGTESYQPCDVGDCFVELVAALGELTQKLEFSTLKSTIIKILDQCEYFVMRNKGKVRDMVDAVSIAPECYRRAFTRLKVKMSFVHTGEITKFGHQFIASPDILAMRKQCKIEWSEAMWNFVLSKMVLATKEMREKGYISEEWFDINGFPKDTTIDGEDASRNHSLKQLHMQRHMMLGHENICSYFNDVLERERLKLQDKMDQKYLVARKYREHNDEAQRLLKKLVTRKLPDGSLITEWEKLELKHFLKIKSQLLIAFIHVRSRVNMVDDALDVPSTKGTLEKIAEEMVPDGEKSRYHLQWAFAVKDDNVIGADPGNAPNVTMQSTNIPSPIQVTLQELSQAPSPINPDFVRKACVNFASLEDRGEDFVQNHLNNLPDLDPETFSKVLILRLPRSLKERGIHSTRHAVWDFVFQNMKIGAAILKLHGVCLNDSTIQKRGAQDSLFSNIFMKNTECLSGRPNSILDSVDDQVGSYLYEDEDGVGILRSGSAAVGLRTRHNAHARASRQGSDTDMWSHFYSCYPDLESNQEMKGKLGNFHQLRQITGVRFKREMKLQVADMFYWDEKTLSYLEEKNVPGAPTLSEKKHRMVCYFFEKLFDLMIGLHQNLSKNPGFESFIGNWDGARR